MRVVIHRHDLHRVLEYNVPLAQVLQGAADGKAALHGHGGGGGAAKSEARRDQRSRRLPATDLAEFSLRAVSTALPAQTHRRLLPAASAVPQGNLELVVLAGGALRWDLGCGFVHLRFRASSF